MSVATHPQSTVAAATDDAPGGDLVLRVRGLQRHYPGVKALDWAADDELEVRAGTIHGLLGENGAGKSTMFAAIAGTTHLAGGSMELLGRPYRPRVITDARASSVELILQEPGLVPSLTVAENFLLGRGADSDARGGVLLPRRADRIARAALADIAPGVAPGARVDQLSLEDQKLVELARAVHWNPALLLVDELSACLGRSGLQVLHRVLDERRRAGTAVLYISHYLEEIETLCDTVTVLKDGRLVATLPAGADPAELTRLMVGRPPSELFPAREGRPAGLTSPTLRVEHLYVEDEVHDLSLAVHPGEVVGVAGLIGCGSEVLGRVVFGDVRPDRGRMQVDGAVYDPRSPRQAIAHGVAYVPPNRDSEGLVLRAPIADNVLLPTLRTRARLGAYAGIGDSARVARLVKEIGVKCRNGSDLPIGLSGGNRQKVVLAKWLLRLPRLLVLHNPTRGIDVGAKSELYALVREIARAGTAVLLIS
ncbi:MAG: sugar ABC transporter ATP-binding protein, partial [Actinomycetota bacterium]|nr:sugar ABC transporter ATP-binding protein [Actinomycetota bacterium]